LDTTNIKTAVVCGSPSATQKRAAAVNIDLRAIVTGDDFDVSSISDQLGTITSNALDASLGSNFIDSSIVEDSLSTDEIGGPTQYWWVILIVVLGALVLAGVGVGFWVVHGKEKYSPRKRGDKGDDIESRLKTVSESSQSYSYENSSETGTYTGSETGTRTSKGGSSSYTGSSGTEMTSGSFTGSTTETGTSYTETGSYSSSS